MNENTVLLVVGKSRFSSFCTLPEGCFCLVSTKTKILLEEEYFGNFVINPHLIFLFEQ